MTLNRRTAVSALALLGFATFASFPMASPASADGSAQYCLSRGGTNGESNYVGDCVYSDYQQCLQAAADRRANCVPNIDYRPGSAPPAARRSRRAR